MKSKIQSNNVAAIIKQTTATILISIFLVACSTARITTAPNAQAIASGHQTFAVLPPTVTITESGNVTHDERVEMQRQESLNFQREIHAWLENRRMQGRIQVNIQDVAITNYILSNAGYPETPLPVAELGRLLGVDGIMTSNFVLTRPMSQGLATAALLLGGRRFNTNQVRARLSISDCESGMLIWTYEDRISGGLGSSPSSIVDQLMRQASRRMPHVQ